MQTISRILRYSVVFFLCVLSFLAAFYLHEKFAARKSAGIRREALRDGIYMMELYPYTGFHMQANYHHVGPSPERQPYRHYDIRTGDLGFFDFSLTDPYPKKPGEFRIIWTG